MKYALVTGGSRGLGRAVCLAIAKTGTPVIVNYQSNEEAVNILLTQGLTKRTDHLLDSGQRLPGVGKFL